MKLRLTVVDTPGYGDAINSQDWYVPTVALPAATLNLSVYSSLLLSGTHLQEQTWGLFLLADLNWFNFHGFLTLLGVSRFDIEWHSERVPAGIAYSFKIKMENVWFI